MKKFIICIFLLLFISTGLVFSQETQNTYKYPYAIVPYITQPPVINGKIQKGSLKNFLAITGMVSFGDWVKSLKTIVPNIQQVVWYLGYNNKYLYIMMKSPNPPGIWPYVNPAITTNGRQNLILFEDHVEIQLAKSRKKATYPGIGFYKINVNPKGYYAKHWYFDGTPGTGSAWPFAGKIKCFVDKKAWYMEIAVDIRSFGEKDLTNKKWVIQLLRADQPGGLDFAGWVGSSWMEWSKFGEVKFSNKAPVFRFLSMGHLVHGNMNLQFEVMGQTNKKVPVGIKVNVYNAANKKIFSETKKCIAVKSQIQTINFISKLPLSIQGRNKLKIYAYYLEKGKAKPLYRFQAPVIDYTKTFWDAHIVPWLKTRPKGNYNWDFAYWPGYNVAETSLNFNVFGLPKKIESARNFEVIVQGKKDGKFYGILKGNISDKQASGIIKGLNLPIGNYIAKLTLYNKEGQPVSTREIQFVKKTYPWEHNKLGISDRVIPPYTAIKQINKNTFTVWDRKYILRNDGLFSSIYSGGGTGIQNILSGKMSFKGEVNNQPVKVTNSQLTLRQEKPGKIKLESTGMLGSVKYRVKSHISYDGWYDFNLRLIPTNKTTYINKLYLSIPLWNKVDTIYIQRSGDIRVGNKFGNLPKGYGLIWSSLDLLPYIDEYGNNWGSFAPIVFLGNGDKGLWWFADKDLNWKQSKHIGCVEVYRNKNGTIKLRINIISEKDKIDKSINIHFAFLVDPVKPVPNIRKWEWGVLKYGHNTDGYRLYGDSVDGFETTHKDRVALREEFLDPDWKPELTNKKGQGYGYFRDQAYNDVGVHHEMYVLYGSADLTGLGLPGFKTFGGEWLGQTNWKPQPQTEYTERTNMEGSTRWKTPRQLTTVGVNWVSSFQEAFIWYYYKLLKDVPFNGTWWDNSSVFTIKYYDPKRQKFEYKFNVFMRRRLTKRLNNICWQLGKPPFWIDNMGVDWSFCQDAWHIENDFYTSNPSTTMQQQLPVGPFRAECRIKRGIISRLATRLDNSAPQSEEQIKKVGRSIIAMCLLNDIGTDWWGNDRYFKYIVNIINKEVGFFNGAQFLPYWRNKQYLQIYTPKVYASIYRGVGNWKGHAVIVVVSENSKSVNVHFNISNRILYGKKIKKIYGLTSQDPFGQYWNNKDNKNEWGEFGNAGEFGISGYGVRFLIVK
jgi:hypothetical protein